MNRRKLLTGAIGASVSFVATIAALRAIPAHATTAFCGFCGRPMHPTGCDNAECEAARSPVRLSKTDEAILARGHPANGKEDCNTHPVLCK